MRTLSFRVLISAARRRRDSKGKDGKRKNNQEDDENRACSVITKRPQNVRLEWEPEGWFDEPAGRFGFWTSQHWDSQKDRKGRKRKELIEREGWAEWYQPAFRGQIHTISSPQTDCSGLSSYRGKFCVSSHGVSVDTQAFHELKSRLRYSSTLTQSTTTWPTRLINITTGRVESIGTFSAGTNPSYVIGSYIWSPENLPKYSRLERRERKVVKIRETTRAYSNDDREYCTGDFDAVVDLVKAASRRVTETPKFWIIEEDNPLDYERVYPHPCLDGLKSDGQRAYIKEVYYLMVAEAHLMGVKYVWLDSLCINQNEPLQRLERPVAPLLR